MDSTTRTGGRTSRDFTVRGVRAQNARFERMRARQRARQLSWRSGWIVGTHSHVPSCANTSTGISAFMAATHLEARAARVHVRVKVFEELLAAFRQQCRRTLRHLCRGSSTRSPSPRPGFGTGPFSFLFLEGSFGKKAEAHHILKSGVFLECVTRDWQGQRLCCLSSRPTSAGGVDVGYRCSVPNAWFPSPS